MASGVWLAVFALRHMNSVFIMARTILGIHTDYVFATGGGMMIPSLAHPSIPSLRFGWLLSIGAFVLWFTCRPVGHGYKRALANKLRWVGAGGSALVSVTIMLGLIGVRVV